MTEIKLTKRYPNSRTEDITDAYMRGWNDALDAVQNGKFIINDDRKTEPQKIGYCNECKWFRDKQVCGRCRNKNMYAPKDEPQTDGYMTAEQAEDYRKMLDKAEHKVYGNIEDEPQTEREGE